MLDERYNIDTKNKIKMKEKKSYFWPGIMTFAVIAILFLFVAFKLVTNPRLAFGGGILLVWLIPGAIRSWWKTIRYNDEVVRENKALRKENEMLKQQSAKA